MRLLDVNALREIPARDSPAEMSEHLQRIGDAAGGKNADADTESDGHHREYAGVALHLVNARDTPRLAAFARLPPNPDY